MASGVLITSLLFAPRRGLLQAFLRERQVADRIRRENLLKDLYLAGERQGEFTGFVSWPLLMGMRGQTSGALTHSPPFGEGWRASSGDRSQ